MSDLLFQNAVQAHHAGKFEEAARLYGGVLRANPRHFAALVSFGYLHFETGRFVEAERILSEAIRLNPQSPEALFFRGCALERLGRSGEALACFDAALALRPNFVDAQLSRAGSLKNLGRRAEALETIGIVLLLNPSNATALIDQGLILADLGRIEDALAAFDKAIAAAPTLPQPMLHRAALLAGLKRYEEAARLVEAALKLDANIPYARGHLCSYRMSICDWRHFEEDKKSIAHGLGEGKRVVNPFINVQLSESAADQLQCARIWAAHETPASVHPLWRGERYSHGKIRIAYVSADFHAHATSALMAGVFEQHDRNRFETVAISFGPDDRSEMRNRVTAAFDRFVDVRDRSEADIARMLKSMEIDIAVDLKGYTKDNRARIFAFRPAPIQVSYLGYPGTMGAPYIDYILADRIVIPAEQRPYYDERAVYLPDTYQCNDVKRPLPPPSLSRASAGLPETAFIYCCFNNNYKITPAIFALWMRILRSVDGSVLWLFEDNPQALANLRREAQAAGVAADRIIAAPRTSGAEHLARHHLADVFLDTLPYGAHTTASDALWMGLPVLTTLGPTFASRVAASLLHGAGLPEMVAQSLQEYEQTAVRLAGEPSTLASLKAKLVHNREICALFDTTRFVRNLEAAYIAMWQRHQDGTPPADIVV
jgi:predicted O-linked N-acetylglucosamine transferase (SPINDLY family)